jgi:hypothetical protein
MPWSLVQWMKPRPFTYIRDKMIPIADPIREPKSHLERTQKCHVLPALNLRIQPGAEASAQASSWRAARDPL